MGWETGTTDSGLAVPLEESYSINGNPTVVGRGGKLYTANSLHNIKVVKVDWAREGTHVVKVYADGRNHGTRRDYAHRAEFGAVQNEYVFAVGDHHYYTMSFWPDSSWDQVSKYSTVISQWKMSPGNPHAALRLSNVGDYNLTFRGYDLWKGETDEGKYIGRATPRAWNDIKVYAKWSMGSDGFIRVWLNGAQVFSHRGRTLLKKTTRGYVKFGMYTEIRDKRTLYFDAVSFSDYLDVPFDTWLKDQANLPSVGLTSPSNRSHLASGRRVTLAAVADDPGGKKFGTAGGIAKVEFFDGKCSVGRVRAAPYTLEVAPRDGPHAFTAVATDSDGNVATSGRADVFLGNKPPEVALVSPRMLANLRSGERVTVRASAKDPDGAVSRVAFYVGDSEVAVARRPSGGAFTATWQPNSAGAYSLHAVATDADGKSSRSAPLHVTVDATIAKTAVTATDDASLQEEKPSKTANWGEVQIYGKPGGCVAGVFRFDISSYKGSPEVRKATLRLYAHKVKKDGGVFSVFGTYGRDWKEDTVTWSKGPSKGDRVTSLSVGRKGRYYEFDVTRYISEMVRARKGYATLWLEDESRQWREVQFASIRRDAARRPRLEVTTSSIPSVADDAGAPETVSPRC